jgi:hypothetical protein
MSFSHAIMHKFYLLLCVFLPFSVSRTKYPCLEILRPRFCISSVTSSFQIRRCVPHFRSSAGLHSSPNLVIGYIQFDENIRTISIVHHVLSSLLLLVFLLQPLLLLNRSGLYSEVFPPKVHFCTFINSPWMRFACWYTYRAEE